MKKEICASSSRPTSSTMNAYSGCCSSALEHCSSSSGSVCPCRLCIWFFLFQVKDWGTLVIENGDEGEWQVPLLRLPINFIGVCSTFSQRETIHILDSFCSSALETVGYNIDFCLSVCTAPSSPLLSSPLLPPLWCKPPPPPPSGHPPPSFVPTSTEDSSIQL